METKKLFEFAVVLAPAIICFVLCVGIYFTPWLKKAIQNLHELERKVSFASRFFEHAAFYGSGVLVVLKVAKGSAAEVWVIAAWVIIASVVSYWLETYAKLLEDDKKKSSIDVAV